MRRYYPRWTTILVGPLAAAVALGVPFTRPPLTFLLAACIFLIAFLAWRYFLSIEVSDNAIRGRHPQSLRRSELNLADVVLVKKTKLTMSSLDGWALHGRHGQVVFVHDGAFGEASIRALVEDGVSGSVQDQAG